MRADKQLKRGVGPARPQKFRSWLTGVALLAGALGPVGAPGVACASSSAALVVATGSNDYAYCVELGGSSVNGIQLIQKASQQHGLQYKLGYGGKAVCMLANVGAGGSDCFGKHPYFWGLWRGDGSGGWSWSGTGAANIEVNAGDIQGWSWGTGDSGSSHPPPPQATYESVCGAAPSQPPSPEPGGSEGGSGGGKPGGSPVPSGGSGDPGRSSQETGGSPGLNENGPGHSGNDESNESDDTGGRKKSKRDDQARDRRDEGAAIPSPSASVTPVASSDPAGARAPDSNAPTAAFVALGAAAVLGAAGAVLVRRRRETT